MTPLRSGQTPLTGQQGSWCGTAGLRAAQTTTPSCCRAQNAPPTPHLRPPLSQQRHVPAPPPRRREGLPKGSGLLQPEGPHGDTPAPRVSPGWSQPRAGPAAAQRRSRKDAAAMAATGRTRRLSLSDTTGSDGPDRAHAHHWLSPKSRPLARRGPMRDEGAGAAEVPLLRALRGGVGLPALRACALPSPPAGGAAPRLRRVPRPVRLAGRAATWPASKVRGERGRSGAERRDSTPHPALPAPSGAGAEGPARPGGPCERGAALVGRAGKGPCGPARAGVCMCGSRRVPLCRGLSGAAPRHPLPRERSWAARRARGGGGKSASGGVKAAEPAPAWAIAVAAPRSRPLKAAVSALCSAEPFIC